MNYSKSYDDLRAMFWDGKESTDTDIRIYCLDKDGIEHSVYRALRDYTARTEKLEDGQASTSVNDMLKALDNKNGFIKKLEEYFTDPAKDKDGYKGWHEDMCKLFMDSVKKLRPQVCYGKAQKIVNMSMKTIFCLEGAKEKYEKGYFDHCHMALDSFTLGWFWDSVAAYCNDKKEKGTRKICKYNIPTWSSIEKDDITSKEGKPVFGYDTLQKKIIGYFESSDTNIYKGLTQFEAEFYIWHEAQLILALKGIKDIRLDSHLANTESGAIDNASIKALLTEVSKKIDALKKYYC